MSEQLQEYLEKMAKSIRDSSFADSPQITLGEIIAKLESMPMTYESQGKVKAKPISFDFANAYPTSLSSWRGSYAELAITFGLNGYTDSPDDEMWNHMEAARFLKMLKDAVGKEYTGWKGGEFTMSESTPVWVSNDGNVGSTGVMDVIDNGYEIIIMTQYCDY